MRWQRVSDSDRFWTPWYLNWGLAPVPASWGDVDVPVGVRGREAVLVDGTPLRPVLSPNALSTGTLWVDEEHDRLVMRGFTFDASATPLTGHMAYVSNSTDVTIEDNAFRHSSWGGLGVCCTDGITIRNNRALLLVSRQLLEDLGGFDESFPFAGEDVDLGWRAREHGVTMAFAEEAVAHHTVWPRTFTEYLRERATWAELVRVVGRHPGIRQLLVAGVFFRRGHVTVVVGGPAVLGLGAATSRWVVPAAVTGYVAARTVRTRASGWSVGTRALWSGQWLVANAWEARASLRYRTLVL